MVFLTDVDGLYENFENKDLAPSRTLTLFEAQYMVENNIVSTGMIPKLKSCIHALFRACSARTSSTASPRTRAAAGA